MTLKRYRMEIVDGRVQERHDAGTGEWYAASEVDHEMKLDKVALLTKALKGLLQDSQHIDHDCGDTPDHCPVLFARNVLAEIESGE